MNDNRYNFEAFLASYDHKDSNTLADIETDEFGDIVINVYDTTEMIEKPKDVEEFHSIVEENGLDIYDFKTDIFTVINKGDY